MCDVCISFRRRHEHLDGLTDQLVARVASQDREALVRVTDHAALVDEGDPVGQHLKQVDPGEGIIFQVAHYALAPVRFAALATCIACHAY